MRACLSNAYQALDVIHHSLLSSWDPLTSTTANTSREPPTRVGHLDSRQSCDLPSNVAAILPGCVANDDIGSHDRPSKGPRFRQQIYQSRATLSTDKSHYRKRTHYPKFLGTFLAPPAYLARKAVPPNKNTSAGGGRLNERRITLWAEN